MKKFKKQFKRYILTFTCMISCVVVFFSINVFALSSNNFVKGSGSFDGVYFRKNVDQVWNIDPNTVKVRFYSTTFENSDISLGLESRDVNWKRFDTPIVFSARYGSNASIAENGLCDSFELKMQFFNFGKLFPNSSIQQTLSDEVSYALDFKLMVVGWPVTSSLWPGSFMPSEDFKFYLRYNDGTQVVDYNLKYHYSYLDADGGRYGTFKFYNEIPGYILKKIEYFRIVCEQDTVFKPQLQFGFPADTWFKIGLYDPLTAPVYNTPYSDINNIYDAESQLNSDYVSSAINKHSLVFSGFTQVLNSYLPSINACKVALDRFFSISEVNSIFYITISVVGFVVLLRLIAQRGT